jgi:metal-responsive CopG/Arc/MetJ family transcriptional regulator
MQHLDLAIPRGLVQALDVVARQRGVNRSECIRQCIRFTVQVEVARRRDPEGAVARALVEFIDDAT